MLPPVTEEALHTCTLPKNQNTVFEKLHPAGVWTQRVIRCIRKLTTLNFEDQRCKEFIIHNSAARAELKRHILGPHKYIIHPFSKLSFYLDWLFFVLMLQIYIGNPFEFPSVDRAHMCFRKIRSMILLLIILSFFGTGYINWDEKEIYLAPKKIAVKYMTTYFFVDLFIAIESLYMHKYISSIMLLANLTVIFNFIRLNSFNNHVLRFLGMLLNFRKSYAFCLSKIFSACILLHALIFLVYWIPTGIYTFNHKFPNDSWIIVRNLSFTEYNYQTYTESTFVVLSFFFGTNYSEYFTVPLEQFLIFLITLSGRVYMLVLIAKVLVFFGVTEVSECNYDNQLQQVSNYMRSWNIPPPLKTKVFQRIEYKCQKRYFNEKEMTAILPEHLKIELFLFSARSLVRKNVALRNLPKLDLGKLFAYMKSDVYAPHEIIMSSYDSATVYFVLSGTVACFNTSGVKYLHFEDGDIFGVMTLTPSSRNAYPHYTVAVEMTEIFSIRYKYFRVILQEQPEILRHLENLQKDRIARYIQVRDIHKKNTSVLNKLRSGRILEQPRKRHILHDL